MAQLCRSLRREINIRNASELSTVKVALISARGELSGVMVLNRRTGSGSDLADTQDSTN